MSDKAQNEVTIDDRTVIKVVGVGGAGGNAVNRMVAEGLKNVEFVAINTDAKDLMRSEADVKIALSDEKDRGLGAGADPEKGAKAAQDHQSDIEEALKGADMVFVTCGEGGGTGTGASPLVARCARQLGALTIAVVTRPFSFEGPRRAASAASGIENLSKEVDAIIVIPNDRLLELADHTITIIDAFKTADSALLAGVQGITDIITSNSYIHTDFADVTAILKDSGTALFGIGAARGEQRAAKAAEISISSPLLEAQIDGAHGILVNVAGPTDLSMLEVNEAVKVVSSSIHPEAQIIWGLTLNDEFGDEVRVTVIAAGFELVKDKPMPTPMPTLTTDAAPTTPEPAAQPAESEPSNLPRVPELHLDTQAPAPSGFAPEHHSPYQGNDFEDDEQIIPDFLR
ncbi:cell division protein FtsZ [Galliscardovia ingluviei]|uniref:Cell division protein FtsZ n=1 Tax=Galliscardovia ingluviei TaxID=1769422 RepID=A0A8J3EY66_9BIFI|nr:cell division protein FtsZ [Galliscardovia ingluviei]GGI13006.1 cell division protein FtsZ [Galliscardovia ingluviei]